MYYFIGLILLLICAFIYVLLQLRISRNKIDQLNATMGLAEETGGIGVWELDRNAGKITWSPYVFALHARDPSKGPPEFAKAICYYRPDERSDISSKLIEAMETGGGFAFRAGIIGEDGVERRILARGTCKKDALGNVTGLYGVLVDLDGSEVPARYSADPAALQTIYGNRGPVRKEAA